MIQKKQNRAAYYLRVSTESQELQNQRAEIVPFIENRGWRLVHTFEDSMSGRKTDKDRPGFAAMLMLLTAVDAGLGALFFGIFPEHLAGVRAEFGVPDAFTPIGAIALGYAMGGDAPSPSLDRGRKPFDAVVHRGHWSEP